MIHVFLIVFLAGGVYFMLTSHIDQPHHDEAGDSISKLTVAVEKLLLITERNVADIKSESDQIKVVEERVRQLEISQGKSG